MLGSDYSLQPQLGGFLDQSHMFFNNGVGANPRKRSRETVAATAAAASQPSPPTLVNLSQLHTQQPNVVSTGLRLAFGEQQHQHQHQHQHQQQSVFPSYTLPSFLTEDLATQIKQQRDEIEQFLQVQSEQLRRTLTERRQKHYRALLGTVEESASRRLKEKDAEVEKAVRRNAELEERVARLRVEAQVWEAKARAQEVTAASLQAQLQQAMMVGVGGQNNREEGFGCDGGEGQADDAESAHIDPERVVPSGPMCKACWKRVATVLLMPCRHLCLCTGCDAGGVEACPLCFCPRSGSFEVYLP